MRDPIILLVHLIATGTRSVYSLFHAARKLR